MARPKRVFKSHLPDREAAICSRLREVRLFLKLPQVDFAAQVAMPRDRFASYEDGRAPLRCEAALTICRQFVVSERWLAVGCTNICGPAFGTHYSRQCMNLAVEKAAASIPPRTLFSSAFDTILSPVWDSLNDASFLFPRLASVGAGDSQLMRNWFDCFREWFVEMIAAEKRVQFLLDFLRVGWLLHDEYLRGEDRKSPEWALFPTLQEDIDLRFLRRHLNAMNAEIPLDSDLSVAKMTAMKRFRGSLWSHLRTRLHDATAREGSKVRLAAALGVTPGAVSQWLSGGTKPTAEATLRLLQWVEQAEAQQKTPGSVTSTARGERTQRRPSKHEKPTSGPP